MFKDQVIAIVYKSTQAHQILLNNPKDKLSNLKKSGIYEIKCKYCDKKTHQAFCALKEEVANILWFMSFNGIIQLTKFV